jgi:hypothetical protein
MKCADEIVQAMKSAYADFRQKVTLHKELLSLPRSYYLLSLSLKKKKKTLAFRGGDQGFQNIQ